MFTSYLLRARGNYGIIHFACEKIHTNPSVVMRKLRKEKYKEDLNYVIKQEKR